MLRIAVVVALFTLGAATAYATDVCTVQDSPDVFVTLRAEPSPMSAEIARAKPGEVLVIQKTGSGDLIERGRWIKVFHYPGEVVPDAADPEHAKGRIGWMHRSFVGDCG